MKIPFHKPIFPDDLNQLLKESTDSGWVTTGPKVKEFERKLSEYMQTEYVISVNSKTAALHLALAANGIGAGDKFIAPTYTFVASVEVGEYLGAEPIFVDSEPDTFNLDLDEVKERLKKEDQKIIDIDGVRVENEEGWFLMRASNTQNQLTCRAESISEKGLRELIDIIEYQLSLSGVNYKFTI